MAFYEINNLLVKQDKLPLKTRWFKGDNSDLFLWQDENQDILSFQLSFGGIIVEWTAENGLRTGKIDDGEDYGRF